MVFFILNLWDRYVEKCKRKCWWNNNKFLNVKVVFYLVWVRIVIIVLVFVGFLLILYVVYVFVCIIGDWGVCGI